MLSDACRRRVGPVRGAECIVHEDVAKLRQRARETRVVLLLAAEEARVFEQHELTWLCFVSRLDCLVGVRSLDEAHSAVGYQIGEAPRYGLERIFGVRLALWAAK